MKENKHKPDISGCYIGLFVGLGTRSYTPPGDMGCDFVSAMVCVCVCVGCGCDTIGIT